MIPVDAMLLDAFRYSHVKSSYLSVYEGVTQVSGVVRISDGSVTADRNQKARRSLDCTIPLSQWEDVVGLSVVKSRIQAWTGYDLGGSQVLIPLGVFRVDELGRAHDGALRVTGTSLESYVMDDTLIDEGDSFIVAGTNIINKIQYYITDSLPEATFELDAWATSLSTATTTFDYQGKRDRWEVVTALASEINCDVFVAPNGDFRIFKRPSMLNPTPVWRINEGPDGVLVGMNTRVGRAGIYNAVLVLRQSSDSAVAPLSAFRKDEDPLSPTVWGGLFGKKTLVYQDDQLSDDVAVGAKADELLAYHRAEDRFLDFSAIPNPALEPDDVVEVSMLDGTVEHHLITRMTIPLGLGEWNADTLSNKSTELLNP